MQFRDATIEDLPVIVDIYNSTIEGRMVTADTSPVTVSDKSKWFHEHSFERRPLWMCEVDSKVIGWISFQDFYGRPAYNGTAEISIYLAEKQRGKGYGRRALEYSIQKSPELGITTLLGFIFAHNAASLQLFTGMGFEEWANLKNIALIDDKEYSLKILGKRIMI